MPEINFELTSQQGPLKAGFKVDLEGSYIVLVGPNNVAKTSILQAVFRTQVPYDAPQATSETCLILPERIFVDTTTQNFSTRLENYNQMLASTMINTNKAYQGLPEPVSNQLPKLLLNHSDFAAQVNKINEFFEYFGLPKFVLRGTQEITFDQVQVAFQGSGLRSIFAILAALTDNAIKLLLIDEPEQSLEAGVQKRLRDLFYTVSSGQGKQIIVTTHSHLFLNRRDFASNYAVTKTNGQVSIHRVASVVELYDITFRMLGNSVEDLFFPYNYMVVEGWSDEVIVNKVMTLKGLSSARIKVLSASGVDNVPNILHAVSNSLTPLVVNDSPYANRVVALVDRPRRLSDASYKELKRVLKDRLFTLDQHSLEAYLPDCLYEKCGRNKQADIEELKRLKDDYEQLRAVKTQISNAIANVLTVDDIQHIPLIAEAIDKAST